MYIISYSYGNGIIGFIEMWWCFEQSTSVLGINTCEMDTHNKVIKVIKFFTLNFWLIEFIPKKVQGPWSGPLGKIPETCRASEISQKDIPVHCQSIWLHCVPQDQAPRHPFCGHWGCMGNPQSFFVSFTLSYFFMCCSLLFLVHVFLVIDLAEKHSKYIWHK